MSETPGLSDGRCHNVAEHNHGGGGCLVQHGECVDCVFAERAALRAQVAEMATPASAAACVNAVWLLAETLGYRMTMGGSPFEYIEAKLAEKEADIIELGNTNAYLSGEVERLRGALDRVLHWNEAHQNPQSNAGNQAYCKTMLDRVIQEARAALEGE